jgi:hypothetical protein
MTLEELPANPMHPYIDAVRASTGADGAICVSCMQHGGHPEFGEWGHWSIHVGDGCSVIGRTFDEVLEKIVVKLGTEMINRQIDPIALGM